MEMRPKPLVGGESPDDAKNGIERMENYFREFNCTEDKNMETLSFLVEGRARKWWRSTSAPIISTQGVATWADFPTDFHELYFPPALRQEKASELLGLKQGSISIDEYQHKFFDLLTYYPQISGSTEEKYNLFLQVLNPEIHDRVAVGDDMTYEGLFGSTSSSPGSGGVMRFGKKGQGPCNRIVINIILLTDVEDLGACFRCGEIGHMKRDCPQAGGAGFGSGSGSHATVFALRHDQAVDENERVIAGTFMLCSIPAFVLIETGAYHSFIFALFVKRHKLPYISLDAVVVVSTPTGQSASAKSRVMGCPLEFEWNF
ncbi:uncharacterized protein [Henckelia pumila]|uniref:uncharacterized protein n=1 Tax=Henckelia pumila TaxID=405737 RepID=UPI003C6DE5F9